MIATVLNEARQLQYFGDQPTARKVLEPFRFSDHQESIKDDHAAVELAYGDTFLRESRFIQAGRCYARALELAEAVKDKKWELQCQLSLARILFHQKDFKNARDGLQQILNKALKSQFKAVAAEALGLIGEIKCSDEWNFTESKKLHQQSLKLFEEIHDVYGIADQLSNLARVYFNLKDFQRAYELFQDSLARFNAIGDKNQIAIQINNIAIVHASNSKYDKAIELFNKALKIREAIGNYAGMANIQENIAHIYHVILNKNNEAISWYQQAIESLEVIRHQIAGTYQQQQSYIGEFFEVYQKLVDLLCQKFLDGNSRKVFNNLFQYTERSKAYVLLTKIANPTLIGNSSAELLSTDEEKLKLLRAEINSLAKEIVSNLTKPIGEKNEQILLKKIELEKQLAALEFAMTLRNIRLEALSPAEIPSLDFLQQHILKHDEVLLSYYITLFEVYCLEISGGRYALHRLGEVEKLKQLLTTYSKEIQDFSLRDQERYTKLNYQLWRFLTLNGKLFIDQSQTYFIFPDTLIGQIAFDGLTTTQDWETPKYIGANYRILYYPSVSFFVNSRVKKSAPIKQKRSLNFLGVAISHSVNFGALKNARAEIELTRNILNGTSQILLEDNQATKENFKREIQEPILYAHIATHGVMHPDELQQFGLNEPALVFSEGDSGAQDTFLTVSEIFGLKINARLVVLSACVTGTGELLRGEGINSIARAFIGAGAQCVIVTLWKVWDQACLLFMTQFYRELKSQSILEAFVAAKKASITNDCHPLDWAAFIIVGNGQQKLSEGITHEN